MSGSNFFGELRRMARTSGAVGGMLWASIPAFLRTRFNTNEILVSLMLVYVANFLLSWLVHEPWRDPEGLNFPQSRQFTETALYPMLIEGTRLNFGFLISLAAVAAGYVFLNRSFMGFQMRVAGLADAAAKYAGFSARRMVWLGLLIGGALLFSTVGRKVELGSLEADLARLHLVLGRGDRHHRAQQVVRQQVRPDLLLDHLGALAAQDVHLHR